MTVCAFDTSEVRSVSESRAGHEKCHGARAASLLGYRAAGAYGSKA